jgi:hypothetical protein
MEPLKMIRIAKYAPVVPLTIAQILDSIQMLGDYHLLLAHDVMASDRKRTDYGWIYGNNLRKTYPNATIIMDNSVIELGDAVSYDTVRQAALTVNADYQVAFDVLLDAEATIEGGKRTLEDYRDQVKYRPIVPLMGVVQGKTIDECMKVAEFYAQNPEFHGICVPRCLTAQLGSRLPISSMLYSKYRNRFRTWHMMGFSDSLLDDFITARVGFFDGIDSAAPIRNAINGQKFDLMHFNPGPRGTFWDTPVDQAQAQIRNMYDTICAVKASLDPHIPLDF